MWTCQINIGTCCIFPCSASEAPVFGPTLKHIRFQICMLLVAASGNFHFSLELLLLNEMPWRTSMSSDFSHYTFRMPNIGFQNLPLNIYIVVFGTAIFVFILSLLFCCYLIRLRHQAHKELYAYKQVIQKEKVKELNLHEICAVCLEEFKQKDELGICPCKHAFHRKCLIKWLEVRKVCPLCNMPVLQLAQQAGTTEPPVPSQQPLPGVENLV
ncbi:RING finger protein 24 [Syngnathus scovelli]|uniref:RING finger protein 24 n=3 Tax=Syngnathus TaxID=103719 RepID=UPI002110A6FD|nr:RING finger protein 24 isoform X1 [Syngnathus scovelli]